MKNSNLKKMIDDEKCFEIVRKKLLEDSINDFRLVDYEMIPIDQVNGYMGQYFTLKTTISCSDRPDENRVYNFFAKIPPPITSPQYEWVQEYGSFRKEVDLYKTVFPEVLQNLEKRSIPEYFFGRENDIIVLEDMANSGFVMTDKFVSFDFQHCQIIIKKLAKFHAKSIIFEELEKRNLHKEFSHCMQETLWPLTEGRSKRMFDAAVKGVVSMIDLVENLDDSDRQKLKNTVQARSIEHAKKLLPSEKHRNVLCHGDLWANNILFKYHETGEPEACCFIDFQLARYNPPAHDILCFLQFTTTRDLRENEDENLFKIYWNSMAESLSDAGLEAEQVFPWNKFVESLEELRPMCMEHGILNIPIMLMESTAASKYFADQTELLESVLYVDRTPLIREQFLQVPQYRKRMSDAILELHESAKFRR
ncbi:uncharacterized protein [Venturia canescens]|uniref:uncharacterized protein n=1 Tax=Venturia canescens TaxID=32260 RepID=UPI001C9C14FA|nr:uncharacterized protein LOC122414483 [Venturia canescens]